MSSINLDELIDQRREATGVEGDRISFEFTARAGEHKGELQTYSFKDPMFLTDDEQDELDEVDAGPDLCCWYLGEEEYNRFIDDGGSSNLWAMVFRKYADQAAEVGSDGRPTRRNRSSRRARRR